MTAFIVAGCSDNAVAKVYNKELVKDGLSCLRLVVFPPDEKLQKRFSQLYEFDDKCAFKLSVSQKSGIVCNSTHNIQTKAVGNFPTNYLKLQVDKSSVIVYSYYIDLKESVSESDVKRAFKHLQEDLSLKSQP